MFSFFLFILRVKFIHQTFLSLSLSLSYLSLSSFSRFVPHSFILQPMLLIILLNPVHSLLSLSLALPLFILSFLILFEFTLLLFVYVSSLLLICFYLSLSLLCHCLNFHLPAFPLCGAHRMSAMLNSKRQGQLFGQNFGKTLVEQFPTQASLQFFARRSLNGNPATLRTIVTGT